MKTTDNVTLSDELLIDEPLKNLPAMNEPPTNVRVTDEPPADELLINEPLKNLSLTNVPPTDELLMNEPPMNLQAMNEPSANEPLINEPLKNLSLTNVPPMNLQAMNEPPMNVPLTDELLTNLPLTNGLLINVPPTNVRVTNVPPADELLKNEPPTNVRPMNVLLKAEGISKSFGAQKVLDNIGINIKSGEILGIIGPNGSGKSTLFNLIAGAFPADTGRLLFEGHDITLMPAYRRSRAGIARTFQTHRPLANLNVLENVGLAALVRHSKPQDAMRRARELLERFGLAAHAQGQTGQLTLFECKKLEIARCLGNEPKLLLLDEIMSGLRPAETEAMIALLQELNREGLTIALIDHVLTAVRALSTRLVLLHHGSCILEGEPAAVLSHSLTIQCYISGAAAC